MTSEKKSKCYEQPSATLILLCAHDIMSDLSGGVQTGGGNIETGFGDIVLNPL